MPRSAYRQILLDITYDRIKMGIDEDLRELIEILNIGELESLIQWKLYAWVEKRQAWMPSQDESNRPKNVGKMTPDEKLSFVIQQWRHRDKQKEAR